jgi:hypothetical protein
VAGAQADSYIKIQENLINANGLVDEGFDRVSETAGFKFQQAMTDLSTASIELGDALVPAFERISRAVSDLSKFFSRLTDGQKSMIAGMAILVATVGPVLVGLGKITLAIQTLTLAMMANPYIALAGAILAIGTYAFFSSRGVDGLNDKIRESLDLEDSMKGTQEERNKLLREQERLSAKLADIEALRAEGGLSAGELQALGQTEASVKRQMGVVRDLSREWNAVSEATKKADEDAKKLKDTLDTLNKGGDNTAIKAQAGSIAALTKELEGLQAQFEATGDSIKRAQLAHQIRGITSEIERLEKMTDPVEEVAIGIQKLSTASFARGQLPLAQLPQHIIDMNNELRETALLTEVMDFSINLARDSMLQFTNLAIQGFADLVVNGGKVIDMLENIGRIVLSGAIQMILK